MASLADKDIDRSICRFVSGLTDFSAHCIDTNTHVCWNIGDEILVVLVEIKHNTENFRQRSEIFSLY